MNRLKNYYIDTKFIMPEHVS